jgi:hypothetical protein
MPALPKIRIYAFRDVQEAPDIVQLTMSEADYTKLRAIEEKVVIEYGTATHYAENFWFMNPERYPMEFWTKAGIDLVTAWVYLPVVDPPIKQKWMPDYGLSLWPS